MDEHRELLRQQTILARFGELALRSKDLDEILNEACRLVGEALGTDLAKVVELQEDGETLLSGGETSLAASATRRASAMASRRARSRAARAVPAPASGLGLARRRRVRRRSATTRSGVLPSSTR